MMSIALFGLTQSNFKTLKDYDSRQKASLHAENSIQILTFLIMHNNSAFKIKNDNTLIPLRDGILIPKILSNNNFNNNLSYFYSIIDLSNGGIVETNNSSYNPFNYGSSSNGYLIILWDKKYGNDPTKEGSIIFFGNYMNNTSNSDYPNNRYNNNGLANSILISFNENTRKVDVSFTTGTFPLYSSYNRLKVNTDDSIQGDVKVNGRRIQKEYMLDIMAMCYSRVPSTSRYVVTYIDQCFINKGYNFKRITVDIH
ncbi:MAG: hypothetical protein RMJ36_07115 [Candidatus Calescibacterium sp.]|nr:hypothetical protein [Candidatus Calescibacterium sp.]MDW8133404.1 hypothetical protein [Candidatus Calescibacterium sp.]